MDQQNNNPAPEKHVPTEAEIARLEAEAVAAMRRGEAAVRREAETAAPAGTQPEAAPDRPDFAPRVDDAPARQDFVPYVDDVPEPEPTPTADPAEADDDDDGEYIPSEMEKRIAAMTPEQWKRWQILGGGALGIAVVVCLFAFGQELATYGLILAALLAIMLPRYLERAWRQKLNTARMAMIVTMLVGMAVTFVIIGMRNGFNFKAQ